MSSAKRPRAVEGAASLEGLLDATYSRGGARIASSNFRHGAGHMPVLGSSMVILMKTDSPM